MDQFSFHLNESLLAAKFGIRGVCREWSEQTEAKGEFDNATAAASPTNKQYWALAQGR